jgi:hypothetical protein
MSGLRVNQACGSSARRIIPVCLFSVSHQVFRVHPSGDKYAWARGNTTIALPGRRVLRQRARQNLEWVISFGRQLVVDVRDNFGPRVNEILVWLPGFFSADRNKKTHRDRYRQEDTGELAIGFTHAIVHAFSRQRRPRRKNSFDDIKPKGGRTRPTCYSASHGTTSPKSPAGFPTGDESHRP